MTVAPLIAEAPETDITSPSRLSAPEECQLDVIDPMVDSVWDRLVKIDQRSDETEEDVLLI